MKKNIAIIMGGYSSEASISLKSGDVVYNHINIDKFTPFKVHILKDKWVVVDEHQNEYPIDKHDFSTTMNGCKLSFDCVFNAIHGAPGENGAIIAYFDLLKLKHTSAGFYQMALTFNKRDCLSVLKSHGIKTAESVYFNLGDTLSEETIIETVGLPCFVKPNRAGSSFGITKVTSQAGLRPAIDKALKEDSEILIERFLEGTEVSIGVIQYQGAIKVLAPTEIVTNNDFFDYEAKYHGQSQEITPARISNTQLKNLNKTAKDIYRILNMSGFTRSEFIFVGDEPYFIEINTVPGLTEASLLPQQAKHAGISLTDLFTNAIEQALTTNF